MTGAVTSSGLHAALPAAVQARLPRRPPAGGLPCHTIRRPHDADVSSCPRCPTPKRIRTRAEGEQRIAQMLQPAWLRSSR